MMSIQGDVQPEQTYAEQYASVLEQLNRKMESIADAAVAFAPPQKHGDLTVIPVAKVRSGFGSGFGAGRPKGQESMQGGVGVGGTLSVTPVGYIEVKEGMARFRPIFTPDAIVKMQVVGGLLALLILGGLGTLFGRRQVKNGERRRGPVFNVVFSPRANIHAGEGRARKRLRGFQPRSRSNEKKTRDRFPRRVGAGVQFPTLIRMIRSKRSMRTGISAQSESRGKGRAMAAANAPAEQR
jgi:uncharacterized spore protein YtfJ